MGQDDEIKFFKMKMLFRLLSSRDEGGKCGSSGTPVTSTGPTTTKRHSSRQAQTQTQRVCSAQNFSRPGQNLRGNSISNNREKAEKGNQVFA